VLRPHASITHAAALSITAIHSTKPCDAVQMRQNRMQGSLPAQSLQLLATAIPLQELHVWYVGSSVAGWCCLSSSPAKINRSCLVMMVCKGPAVAAEQR
jgi:hypothetical protein